MSGQQSAFSDPMIKNIFKKARYESKSQPDRAGGFALHDPLLPP